MQIKQLMFPRFLTLALNSKIELLHLISAGGLFYIREPQK